MHQVWKLSLCALSMTSLLSCGIRVGESKRNSTLIYKDVPFQESLTPDSGKAVADSLKTQLKKVHQSPTITLVMMPSNDFQTSVKELKAGGGKLVYDPNNGHGGTIPFYIAELTPEQINDTAFIKKLNLKAAKIDAEEFAARPIETKFNAKSLDLTSFIPTDSVKLDDLGDRQELGKGITVAVIDTGIDASHPAFGNRVDYWYDATEETKTPFKETVMTNRSLRVDIEGEKVKVQLPKTISPKAQVYTALMSEKNFIGQLEQKDKYGKKYYDLNGNNQADSFLVVLAKTKNKTEIYFDTTGDMQFFGADEKQPKIAYNDTTMKNRSEGMIDFPTRNNILSYPLLLEDDGKELSIGLGKTEGMHGTHVAGIIAANDEKHNLVGAAPQARLMSLKVCSGISCTDSAIIKALYKTFYNGKVIPDVVNISLGSHEQYHRDVYSHIFNDLSAKFGTIFFISASNSGPGFRSLNHFGNSGSIVMVGANVSKKTLKEQYNLPLNEVTQNENLLFFSSLGPSYTGEMKPNIIAPGAAISAVPAAEGYMGQANGTSMSSPLAAGAFAAVLGKVKNETRYLDKMHAIRLSRTADQITATQSLLPYVYGMRDALQAAATELKHLSRAQQGYGLMNSGKTRSLLEETLSELNSGDRDYFEIVINEYKKTYSRDNESKEVNTFKLQLGEDGERTKDSLAELIAKGVDIELDRVEELSHDGAMKVYRDSDATKLFTIVELGDDRTRNTQTSVTFNNRRNVKFHSRRFLEKMRTGKTYLAHYKVNSGGVNITNILDVVHMPHELKKQKISVFNIDPKLKETSYGFALSHQDIKTNVFHRYPIAVDKSINMLKVQAAVMAGATGRLYVQLYDPTGKEVKFEITQNSSVDEYKQIDFKVPVIKNGKHQTGIWELTVSSSSSGWLNSTVYDLLVEGSQFGAIAKEVLVTKGEVKEIDLLLDSKEISTVELARAQEVMTEKVEVMSNYMSFHPLKIAEGYKGKVIIKVKDNNGAYWGNLAPVLYEKSGDQFKVVKGTKINEKGEVNLEKRTATKLYFALDTIYNYTDLNLVEETVKTVDVDVLINTEDKIHIETEIKNNLDLKRGTLKIDASSLTGNKRYRVKVMMFSGQVDFAETLNGQRVLVRNKDVSVNSVYLNIEPKK